MKATIFLLPLSMGEITHVHSKESFSATSLTKLTTVKRLGPQKIPLIQSVLIS